MGVAHISGFRMAIKAATALGKAHQEVPQTSLLGENRRLSVWTGVEGHPAEEGVDNPYVL